MLPKIHRLKKKNDFERAYKASRGFRQDFLSLKFAANNSGITRIGIVVSKKIAPKAAVRNLIKRRIRAAAKEILPVIISGQDIVISALVGADKMRDFQSIKTALIKLLSRAEIINNKNQNQ